MENSSGILEGADITNYEIDNPALATPFEIDYHVGFSTGLNIVPSSASLNITVIYE